MSRFAKILSLLLFSTTATCGGETTDSTEVQRSVTEFDLPDGTSLTALSGAIRQSGDDVVARFTAPSGTFTVTTPAEGAGEKTVLLDNLHRDARVSVRVAQSVTSDGCPETSTLILCETAKASAGNACPTGGCPTGTLCESGVCEPTNALGRCDSTITDVEGMPTRKRLTYTADPCVRAVLEVAAPEVETVSFVVSGAGGYTSVLDDVRADAESGEVDFIVFLGDNLVDASAQGIEQMSTDVSEYPVPVIALAGELESGVSDSPRFVGRFGPGDFAFQYGPLKSFAFTSSGRHLGSRGLDRIRSLIRLATRDDEDDRPLISFTHVPPVDPNGARDLGFINEVEAARTLSLLSEGGVDALVSGHVRGAGSASFGELESIVTSAEEGVFGGELELLRITVGPSSEVDGTIVGDFAFAVERVPR